MKRRTAILADLVDAAKHLDGMQDALTRAHVSIADRRGPDAAVARERITLARDAVYDEDLVTLLEVAITAAGRMP